MIIILCCSLRFWFLNYDLIDYKSYLIIMFFLLMCDVLKEKYFKFFVSF